MVSFSDEEFIYTSIGEILQKVIETHKDELQTQSLWERMTLVADILNKIKYYAWIYQRTGYILLNESQNKSS